MIQTIFGSPVVIIKGNEIEQLIPASVYQDIIDYLSRPENKFVDHPYAKGGRICTTDLGAQMKSDTIDGINSMIEFLKKTAMDYVHLYSADPVANLKFSYYWINLMFQGCEITNHTDANPGNSKRLIVTFYPKVPPGGSNLVFIHNSVGSEWPSDCQEKDLIRIQIDQGDIVIFDTFTLHAVDAHNVEESRMCIATEFSIET